MCCNSKIYVYIILAIRLLYFFAFNYDRLKHKFNIYVRLRCCIRVHPPNYYRETKTGNFQGKRDERIQNVLGKIFRISFERRKVHEKVSHSRDSNIRNSFVDKFVSRRSSAGEFIYAEYLGD